MLLYLCLSLSLSLKFPFFFSHCSSLVPCSSFAPPPLQESLHALARKKKRLKLSVSAFFQCTFLHQSLYSSVVERQSCKLKVLGSIPSGGFLPSFNYVYLQVMSSWCMSSVIACGVFVCGGFERGLLLAMTFFENLIPPPTSQSSIFACNFKTSQIRFPGSAWERTYCFLAR